MAEVAGLKKSALLTSPVRLLLLSILAGAFIALGGALSVVVGSGMPSEVPGLQKLASGLMFPIGLVLVVVLGAELFTGNNALLIPGLMSRKISWGRLWAQWGAVYVGNFVGALFFAYVLFHLAGLDQTPYIGKAISGIAETKTSLSPLAIICKAIGANWCVCLAVWLALAGRTLVDKVVGCWIPVMAFVALGFEHCIANMFFIPAGMFAGAEVTLNDFVVGNLIWSTIGNIIGGAIFVGAVHTWLHREQQKTSDTK